MTVDGYIAQFDGEARRRLETVRRLVREHAPTAVESISYGMPAYKLSGKPLLYFAGYEAHLGLYATPNGHAHFATEFAPYKQGKGSVQFPHDQPLPTDLIQRVIAFRIQQVVT